MRMERFVVGLVLFVCVLGCSNYCQRFSAWRNSSSSSQSSSSSTPSDNLTAEQAQRAIDKFMAANAKGTMTIRGGVREISSENSAVADVVMENFTSNDGRYRPDSTPHGRSLSWKTGKVTFSRFTDGKWVLSQVIVIQDSTGYTGTYKPNIDVQ